MVILITGGAGFIGSHLVELILSKKIFDKIVVIDNLSTGSLDNLPQSDRIIFIEDDVSNKTVLDKIFKEYHFDYIVHLAAIASVQDSINNPEETHRVNFDSVLYLLELARKSQSLKRFIFASSAAVYGDKPNLPCKENDAVNPLTPYGIDKYAAESYVINYYKLYSLPAVAFRFFNVYGTRQNPSSPYSGVISIFNEQFKNNKPVVKIYGDGNQTRDFIFVKDLVEILFESLLNDAFNGEVYNIGTGIQTSLKEIVTSFEEISGKKAEIDWQPARSGDIRFSVADNSKLTGVIPYSSFTSFIDGLRKMIKG